MLVLLDSPRWRWCPGELAGSIWFQILYATSKYLPGHQRHLGEANKTNIGYRAHLFDYPRVVVPESEYSELTTLTRPL